MKKLNLPELKHRTCNQCLLSENHPEFGPTCRDSKSGKHRLRPHRYWFAVLAADYYDIYSEFTAINVISEGCWDPSAYLLAKQFTDAEIAALREGRAKLDLRVIGEASA